ncbi:MAG TPA: transglycosylase SLT domain-containing protein [Terriglobia bacterium]|nr:transglycosylase SLT domain-containing protein [Terriglobia bacterium]
MQRTTTLVSQPPVWAPEPLPPQPTPHPAAVPLPPIDSTEQAIAKAEQAYTEGMADYRAGNLEAAKQAFDRALKTLFDSNLDLESNERLGTEFDKLVEDIHGVELAAIERGDTLSERHYEAPPIESFSGLTFPVDPKIKERVQQEVKLVRSDLPLVSNDYVDGVITYLQKYGKNYVQKVLERRGLYEPLISAEMKKAGLPQDLIYLAAGESAFNPFALSRKGALGIWQFMPGTGALYGLKRNRWVDEREDPVKSTHAAARHLKELYQTFGDWYLAMAAYDWGPEGVQRAIQKTGYADFWTLRRLHALPKETEDYVPIFIATALIAKDPKAYGFNVPADPPLEPDQITVSAPTDLRLVAELIDRPVDDLIHLNPSLLRWTTPANDSAFVLNLPAGTKDTLEKALAAIPQDKRVWWRAHRVEPGETLSEIAHKFRVSPVALAEANQQIAENRPLEEGTHLVLPMAAGDERSLQRVHPRGSRRLVNYRVRPGDTLDLVADRFDVLSYQIRRWNHLTSSRLTPGKVLKVYTVTVHVNTPHRRPTRRYAKSTHRKKPVVSSAHRRSSLRASANRGVPAPTAAR